MKSIIGFIMLTCILLAGCVVTFETPNQVDTDNKDKDVVVEEGTDNKDSEDPISVEGYKGEPITWEEFTLGWNNRVTDEDLKITSNMELKERDTNLAMPHRKMYSTTFKNGMIAGFWVNTETDEMTTLTLVGRLEIYDDVRNSFRHATKVLHKNMNETDWEEIMDKVIAYGSWDGKYVTDTYTKYGVEYKRVVNKDTETISYELTLPSYLGKS